MSEPVTLQTFDDTAYTDSQGVTYDFADCISDGLPPRAMRYTMENKNNLSKRGSIYVGLGEKRETTISFKTDVDGEIQTAKYESAKTGVLEPPTGEDGIYALKLEISVGAYKCKNCGHEFVPTYKQALSAMHLSTTRYLKCPECKKRTWCKKVLK